MFGKILKKLAALAVCIALAVSAAPTSLLAEEALLRVDGETAATNTDNAFIGLGAGGYSGISLSGDYGSDRLSVALIDRRQDKFIIELNGHTLRLGYLALNVDLEIRGEGTVEAVGGIVVYAGELYLGDGVRLETQSSIAVIAHSEYARVRIGEDVTFFGAEEAVAELGIRYEYKDNPVVFDKLPLDATGSGGAAGVDYFRVLYENCSGDAPTVSMARVARFPTEAEAEAALGMGFISVVNVLGGAETEATDDDSFLKVEGGTVAVGKSGAVLSHANLSLDGSIGVNLYFVLSGIEGSVESLGALIYSGVGEGGRIEIPKPNEDGRYKFKVPISPMDMRKTITVRFEGDASGRTWEYSVEKYSRYILGDTEGVYGAAVKDLIASMLNYGSAMQRLNGESEGLAGDILSEFPGYGDGAIAEKTADAVRWLYASGYAYGGAEYRDGEDSPIKFSRMSIAVNETTAIRIYLGEGYPTDGQLTYSLSYQNTTANGSVYERTEQLSAEEITEKGYIEISGVPAGDFDRVFRISVRDKVSGAVIASCETTVLRYALRLYESSAEGSADRALAEALIWYGAQNVAYF